MQAPSADSECNDISCKKDILPLKESLNRLEKEPGGEEQGVLRLWKHLDEDATLGELEDSEEEFKEEDQRAAEMYKQQTG